jgi:hypothetical protein
MSRSTSPRSPSPPRRRALAARALAARAVAVGATVGLVALVPAPGLTAEAGAGPARPDVAATTNPSRSRAPGTSFEKYCVRYGGGYRGTVAQCNSAASYNIDRARYLEGLRRSISLPRDLSSLSTPRQIADISNAERSARGLATLSLSSALDGRAADGAAEDTDPTGPSGYTWVSNWSGGYRTPLAADYGWMYDDGYGSPNEDCDSPDGSGCWAHRDNLLAGFSGRIGAGGDESGGSWSYTALLVKNYPS